jgi:GH24 family phage-related lysozyme (muramidase)
MTNAISAAGLNLIQEFEGFCAEPAQLPDGNWVVGYGHVRVGEAGAPVNQDEAAALLSIDVAPFEALVHEKTSQPLTQAQFDALVSFAFSVGEAAFESSQVLRRVNAGEFVAAACALDAWRKSDVSGELETVDVLVRRRAAEKAMLLKDVRGEAAPSAFVRAKLDYAASILGAPVKYSAAPVVGSIPVAQLQPEATARLIEIMKSEPSTEALLLTQVVDQPANDCDEEITTAHAKPVARKIDAEIAPMVDRRMRTQKQRKPASFKLPHINFPKFKFLGLKSSSAFDVVGLVALFAFGLGLTALGGSILFEGRTDSVALAGATALTAPGLTASFIAGAGLLGGSSQA